MKTNEERIHQLEQAHSRLHNLMKTIQQDIETNNQVVANQLAMLELTIDQVKNSLQQEPAQQELPETLIQGVEYRATIQQVITSKNVKWKDMDYCNWHLKLEGKPDYAFVAFIPQSVTLAAGDKVRFNYANPFQLRKLVKI